MRDYFYLLLAQKKSFKEKKESDKKDYTYFQQILKISQNPIFLTLIFASIMQLTNSSIKPYALKIKQFIEETLPIGFSAIQPSDYVTFLVIIATIGGVFIGLHYAGMSTLNGSLILIAFRLYGFEHIYIVPFIMTIGVGVAIYAFVHLGKNVCNYSVV